MLLELKICIFCETECRLSTCQVSNLSVIWINCKFYVGWYETPKHHYDVNMTSFHNIGFSKLRISYDIIEDITLPSFIGLGCLNQILRWGGEGTDLHAYKMPSLYKVKVTHDCLAEKS